MPKLGTMSKVNITDVKGWSKETDFSSWLANEGLTQLNDLLGLSLEDAEEQVPIGRYTADVVCTDASDSDRPAKAVIEVQLGRSDHRHLGQALAYAAGLDDADRELKHVMRHVIWIAEEFTDEHSKVLDWMNACFCQNVYFFGLEARVKRIGDSDPAVEFNPISMPPNWTPTGGIVVDPRPLTDLQREHLDFWVQYADGFPSNMTNLTTRKPGPFHYMDFAIGFGSNARLSVSRIARSGLIRVQLVLPNSAATGWFGVLYDQRATIEKDVGRDLQWKHNNVTSIVQVVSQADTSDRSDWPNQMQWMYENLEKFDSVFRKRLPPN